MTSHRTPSASAKSHHRCQLRSRGIQRSNPAAWYQELSLFNPQEKHYAPEPTGPNRAPTTPQPRPNRAATEPRPSGSGIPTCHSQHQRQLPLTLWPALCVLACFRGAKGDKGCVRLPHGRGSIRSATDSGYKSYFPSFPELFPSHPRPVSPQNPCGNLTRAASC
jgi:hypothetical protein